MNVYDAPCGIHAPFTAGDALPIPCKLDMHHEGNHDWEKLRGQFQLRAGIFRDEVVFRAIQGSPAAMAMLGIPVDCVCQLSRSVEGPGFERTPNPRCSAHGAGPR